MPAAFGNQDFAFLKNKNRKSPVQETISLVALKPVLIINYLIVFIHHD